MKFEWENIYSDGELFTMRAKVFGGWCILNTKFEPNEIGNVISESMVFVPDPNHEWVING